LFNVKDAGNTRNTRGAVKTYRNEYYAVEVSIFTTYKKIEIKEAKQGQPSEINEFIVAYPFRTVSNYFKQCKICELYQPYNKT